MSFDDVTGIDVLERREAAQQQPGAERQDQRERRLRDDEHVSGTVPRASRRGGSRSHVRFTPAVRAAGTMPHRSPATTLTANVNRIVVSESPALLNRGTGTAARTLARRSRGARRSHADREHAGQKRDDRRLEELPADEIPARRPDRAPDRDVAAPLGAREEEIRHVGAGDQRAGCRRTEQDPERTGERPEQLLLQWHARGVKRSMISGYLAEPPPTFPGAGSRSDRAAR